jgi:hypothetical protein
MAIPLAPPLVVPKTRTRVVSGEAFTQERFHVDLQKQGTADVQWLLRSIAAADTAEQINIGNPPSSIIVDNRPTRQFDAAQRNIVVFFGAKFASAAMRAIEQELRANIDRVTDQRTGRLRNVTAAWRWRLVIPGKGSRIVTSATELPPFVRGMVLVLEPFEVPYATLANMRVRGSGTLTTRKTKRKPARSLGFLGATVRALRSRAEFRQFAITVVFSKRYSVPGELSTRQGTGQIVVQLKRR